MSGRIVSTAGPAASWYGPLARAVPAIALAVVVTFSANHSAALGLITLGVFGIVTGAVVLVAAFRSPAHAVIRGVQLVQGGVSLLVGIIAIVVPGAGLPFLVLLITAFAVVTGFLELYLGLRGRRDHVQARDWMFVGGLTVLLAIAVLFVPPDFVQSFVGPDKVARELTASIVTVGLLGAYWVILGVFLVIAALSLKWSTGPTAVPVRSEA